MIFGNTGEWEKECGNATLWKCEEITISGTMDRNQSKGLHNAGENVQTHTLSPLHLRAFTAN